MITDRNEPISVIEPEASVHPVISDNDIGHAVRRNLSDKDHTILFFDPWQPISISDFPTSVRKSDNKSKSGIERLRRLLSHHLNTYPWLGVSRVGARRKLARTAYPAFCSGISVKLVANQVILCLQESSLLCL